MKKGKKDYIYSILDRFYLRLLTTRYFFSPKEALYHPVELNDKPFNAKREKGSHERLEVILSIIGDTPSSILDIGSAEGYFSMNLAKKGNFVVAIEGKKQRAMIGQILARNNNLNKVSFYNLNLDVDSANALPEFDNVLCLAVWHHWVRIKDLDYANKLLAVIWSKTKKRMFFETGLEELPEHFKLKGNDEEWLLDNLSSTLLESKVVEISESTSFAAEEFMSSKVKSESSSFKRKLYLIERI
ncbi:class I SAM-dependent methyltransferase [Candidatus Pseudothioglobus singularis]|nr:class I SAM-dependent methyltransferase [Candidatus Pseudothioglobus singularis]